ncbi:ribonuclease domain-containing protein [Corynebacterium mendelii]|uniref:Ribonuclease n=1 Tax=Corynebacterium mendelii TaxID=2765362 RepID=A0A939E2H9_9CORY|nr:ribonuclease domain-containing protein [Corynebacterium mendelii]MBN9644252.1 ribonuclease [Corynebacterium mendelii]
MGAKTKRGVAGAVVSVLFVAVWWLSDGGGDTAAPAGGVSVTTISSSDSADWDTSREKRPSSAGPVTQESTAAVSSPTAAPPQGIAPCRDGSLPPQVDQVLRAIDAGGPFNHPDKDGSRFGNYENHLPRRPRDYYREYTVDTPGERSRGARRIVTGGDRQTRPEVYYYTFDHYDSFCLITGRGRQR